MKDGNDDPYGVDHKKYFEYLCHRSWIGIVYRKWFLYPRISKWLHGSVLDFGCGIGDFLAFRVNTIGVDINQYNINFCRARGLKAKLIGLDGVIPFGDRSFSGVVMDNVIEHIPGEKIDAVIAEIIRILQPGGTIVVGVPGIKGYQSDLDHKVFYSKKDLVELFARHNVINKSLLHMPLKLGFLGRYFRQYCIYVCFRVA